MGTLTALWTFWICLIILLVITIAIADAILSGDGLSMLPGSILVLLSLIVAVLATIRFVRFQDRYMGKQTLKTNYIVLAILIVISLALMPTTFIFTAF